MPRVTYEVLSPAEKIKCCKELMQSLFEEGKEVYLSELEYFLKTEEIEFNSGIENQQSQSGFFSATSSSSIEMQPILRESSHETSSHETSSHETSSEDVLGINEYSRGLLNQLIVKLEKQQLERMSTAMEDTNQLKLGKTGITQALLEKLGKEVTEVLEDAVLETDCLEAEKALQETKVLLNGGITQETIAAYREFASTIKSNRSSKSLENLGKTMLVIAGIALAMTLLVAFNVIAASGLLVIAGLLTTAFCTESIGSVLLIDSEPQGLGKAVNDIADNAESVYMRLGNH